MYITFKKLLLHHYNNYAYYCNEMMNVNVTDHQSIEYKLFNDYYSKLVDIVPSTDLSNYFVSEKIITLEDYDKIIRSPTPQEAAKIVLDKVLLQLQSGNSIIFNKMLLIMDHHGVATAKKLSQEIRSKLFAVKHADDVESSQSNCLYVWLFRSFITINHVLMCRVARCSS